MTYLKWRRKKTVNREFWVGHNYPSRTKEKGKHSQINASWGSLLLIDLPCVKCWRVAFRPTAGVLCLLFGVGQGTCILNITYGFFNRKQKNKPKNKQNCITRYIFLSSRLIKTEKKKKKSYQVLVSISYSPLGGCVSWCSHFGKQFGITQSRRRRVDM